MTNDQKYYLEVAYKELENKVFNNSNYHSFITSLADTEEFRELFTFDDKFNSVLAEKALSNLDNLRFICNNSTGLKKEKEFHDMLSSCIKENNAISTIVNTYLMDTKYGNIEREEKDNYIINDKMFYIMQSIFGLNTLVESVKNKDVLLKRFTEISGLYESEDINNFISVIEEMYFKKEEKDVIQSKIEYLKPFILSGLQKQLTEVSNSYDDTFIKYNYLYEIVTDIIGINKKSVK